MTKKSDLSDQLMEALEIIKRLPSHGNAKKITKDIFLELQSVGYEKTERSLQRLLERLTEARLIECDNRSKPYGYRLIQRDVLALGKFTEQEALMLAMVQDHLSAFLPPNAQKGLNGLFQHLNDYWAKNIHYDTEAEAISANKAKNWAKKVRFVPEVQQLQRPTLDSDVLSAVSEALYHDHYLTLHYQKAPSALGDEPLVKIRQRIMPLGLVQQGNRLYLVCRFNGYQNERNLALHRIQKAHKESERFERPKDFCLESYDGQGSFGFGRGTCQLTFSIQSDQVGLLIETPISDDQLLQYRPATEASSAYYDVTATVVDSLLLDRWLLGFGNAIFNIHRMAVV